MKMRYLVIASIASLILFSSFAYGSVYDVFSDVKDPYSYYYGPVYAMSELGVMNGYEDGRFGPDDNMTRAQVATVFHRYHEKVVWPLIQQVGVFHQKGRNELSGASWREYLQDYRSYNFEFSLGGEGYYDGYGAGADFFDDGYEVVYDNLYELGGQEFGIKIIQTGGELTDSTANFVIWESNEMFGARLYGEFRDDIRRLVTEAKAMESDAGLRASDGLWNY